MPNKCTLLMPYQMGNEAVIGCADIPGEHSVCISLAYNDGCAGLYLWRAKRSSDDRD